MSLPGGANTRRFNPNVYTGHNIAADDPLLDPSEVEQDNVQVPLSDQVKVEFNRKYPPDAFGEEASANARVWRVYHDEVVSNDRSLVGGWNKTLDILLIFAGLFSAVSTAFIIESYKQLQPDYTEYTAKLLFTAVSAARNGSGVLDASSISLANLTPPDSFTATSDSRWINGLWFLSLSISLSVSLLCIMAKQWLEDYSSRVSAPAPSFKQWARRHAFFWQGILAWHVPTVIATLPALLHAALFLFLSGLVIFLSQLDDVIALVILGVTGSLMIFYSTTVLLPLYSAACPTRTSFTNQLHHAAQILGFSLRRVIDKLFNSSAFLVSVFRSAHRRPLHGDASRTGPSFGRYMTIILRDRHHVAAQADHLDAAILRWLFTASPVSHISAVAIQAVGALRPWSPTLTDHLLADAKFLMLRHLGAVINSPAFDRYSSASACVDYARYLRAWINLDSAYSGVGLHQKFNWTISTKLPGELRLLEFISCWMTRGLRWEFDIASAQATCLASLRTWNSQSTSPDTAHYPVGVFVRLATDVNVDSGCPPATALCVSLHLFHACRMFGLPEENLALVCSHLLMLLNKLGVHPDVDIGDPLIACIEIWSRVLNAKDITLLDASDVAVASHDLGALAARLKAPRQKQAVLRLLPEFIVFMSSSGFAETRWSLHVLNRVLRLWDPTLGSQGLFLDAPHLRDPSGVEVATTFSGTHLRRIFSNLAQGLLRADEPASASSVTVTKIQAVKRLAHVLRMSCANVDAFPLIHGHPITPSTVEDECESLLCFLHRHKEQECSAWRAFCTMISDEESPYVLLLVADTLSTHLVHLRHAVAGEDFDGMVEELFAVDWISVCMRYYVTSNVLDGVVQRVAQHCSELSPHWDAACDGVLLDDKQQGEAHVRVLKLQHAMHSRGPCKAG
ncbi:hypothetical protein EXIGLDRAFT_660902 [Exidia glandulosa HHB12029]|uniref:DUF6535 domain-containing protein n=1 Tax=Exidia glandulosa HHB12029 TaxID=1314781 RepID=A0A165AYG6_EXIGL|nr:hypothetical protein EXIGLDRAFT_660902 [Exidia glandulosa HHB12029]